MQEEFSEDVSEEELFRRAVAIGVSAVKYQDLKSNRLTNYQFGDHTLFFFLFLLFLNLSPTPPLARLLFWS